MKKYTKPSMEIVDLRVEDKITAPTTTFYRKGINVLESASVVTDKASEELFAGTTSF